MTVGALLGAIAEGKAGSAPAAKAAPAKAEAPKAAPAPAATAAAKTDAPAMPSAKRIAEAHDGELVLRSQPGEGTTVRVRLPATMPMESASTLFDPFGYTGKTNQT